MALSLLSLLGPYVTELYFKDLKQGLKKEQCDVCFYFFDESDREEPI